MQICRISTESLGNVDKSYQSSFQAELWTCVSRVRNAGRLLGGGSGLWLSCDYHSLITETTVQIGTETQRHSTAKGLGIELYHAQLQTALF